MQLTTALSAMMLLSATALAAPQNHQPQPEIARRDGKGGLWDLWGKKKNHKYQELAYGPVPFAIAPSLILSTTAPITATAGASGVLLTASGASGTIPPYASATGIYTNSSACTVPATITSYVTVNFTSTKFVAPSTQNSTSFLMTGTGTGNSAGISRTSSAAGVYTNTTSFSFTAPLTTAASTGFSASSSGGVYTNSTSLASPTNSTTTILLTTAASTGFSTSATGGVYTNTTSVASPTNSTSSSAAATSVVYVNTTITTPGATFIPAPTTFTTTLYPSSTLVPTTTITGVAPSGTAPADALLCGIHGIRNGDYMLGEYVEQSDDVAVTLIGCYQFCVGASIDGNMSCKAYEFYPEPGTGAPRCNLYGGSVSQSLLTVLPAEPNVWYDVGCGAPDS